MSEELRASDEQRDRAAAEVREFAFICLPLKMRGATGSPVRPIAIA